jgi:hypothetical protein
VALAVIVVAFPTVSDGLRWGLLGDLHHFLGSSSERERQRESERIDIGGVAGATPHPQEPWGGSGHPKSHIINTTKYYYIIFIFIYFKNNK